MDLQFADSHISEICRFAIAHWAQQFEDLNLRAHLCKFATSVNGTGSKFAAGVNKHWWQIVTGINNTGGKFTTPVANNGNNISLLTS
jgi:hypothetical protein